MLGNNDTKSKILLPGRVLGLTVIITSLGNFIDIFDMFLFNMQRVKSLTDLGLAGDALTESGLFISNCQMAGMLLGAWISGILGDKFGRKRTLFLSIIVYSLGSIGSALVHNVDMYALARFITGLGLAGELGAGITLIAEKLDPARRGYGIMVFISMGFLGVCGAAMVTEFFPWRQAYMIGGLLGLSLLGLRIWLSESRMYEQMEGQAIIRGGLRLILRNAGLLKKYICAILLMATGVFIPQIMFTLSPELAKAMGITETIKPGIVFAIGFGSGALGDLLAMYLSERLRSRKKAVGIFLALAILVLAKYFLWPAHTAMEFYIWNGLLGLTFGIWVIGAVWTAEHFGINIRATTATTIPNFARALTIPMNLAYGALKGYGPLAAAGTIGLAVFILAFLSWRGLSETYGKNLGYFERS